MKLPRDLSGAELAKVLCKHYGYRQVNQEGSRLILQTPVTEVSPHLGTRSQSVTSRNA